MENNKQNFETLAIRTQAERTQYDEHSVPLYLTSSFIFEDAEDMRASFAEEKPKNLYSRFTNPNVTEFVDKIAKMEGAETGYAFATGMAAIYSTLASLLSAGDHILSCRSVFGSTHTLFTKYFPKWNINTTYFEAHEEDIEKYIRPETKILYLETPTNPAIEVLDLEKMGKIAKKHNLLFVVDNCFATPYIQQPIKYGADIVVHSATKLIDGQGRVLGRGPRPAGGLGPGSSGPVAESSLQGAESGGRLTFAYNSDGPHKDWVEAVCNSVSNTLGISMEPLPYAQFSELRQQITDHTIVGAFRAGGRKMEITAQVPIDMVLILQAVIVLLIAAPALVRWLFRLPQPDGAGLRGLLSRDVKEAAA